MIFFVAYLLIAQAFAQYFITQPVTGVTWNGGDKPTIEWETDSKGSGSFQPSVIVIDLMTGGQDNLQFVLNIVKNLPADTNSFSDWTVPNNLVKGNAYALKMTTTGKDGTKKVNYSSTFTIDNVDGTGSPANKGAPNGGIDAGKAKSNGIKMYPAVAFVVGTLLSSIMAVF